MLVLALIAFKEIVHFVSFAILKYLLISTYTTPVGRGKAGLAKYHLIEHYKTNEACILLTLKVSWLWLVAIIHIH